MRSESLEKHFALIGARVRFLPNRTATRRRSAPPEDSFTIDVKRDSHGEYFEIRRGHRAPELELLQRAPKERHLLLYSRNGQRFLCGHDERHWFVAGIADGVSTVRAAKQSLLPDAVREQVRNLPWGEVDKRRNTVFTRQGEWFFLPVNREFPALEIHCDEPLQRGAGSKPHVCQELVREGGELVYIVDNRKEMTADEYAAAINQNPRLVRSSLRTMVRNPTVYARGTVKHKDHATIHLDGWHRVFVNAEYFTSSVSFLD